MSKNFHNDIDHVLVTQEQLDELTTRLANEIYTDYKDSDRDLLLVCILKGSMIFTSALMQKIPLPMRIDFMKVSSYGSGTASSGIINIHLDLKRGDYSNTDIILIEDIIDSGRTLKHLVEYLKDRGAHSVRTCTLLDKPSRRVVSFSADYVGMAVPDEFVVGYGLDYDELYRNLPYVGVLKQSVWEKK